MATVTSLQIARQGHQVAPSEAVTAPMPQPLDDSIRPVRGVLAAFPSPAGPEMAGSLLSAIVNLPAADGAVSPVRAAAPAEDPRSGLTR